ncbi:MAG: hypothetical protein Q9168_005916 [Polycauliona sp. 1 TL-2023]
MHPRLRGQAWILNNQRMKLVCGGSASVELKIRAGGEYKVTHPEPDQSIYVEGQSYPFLVMETANSQSQKELDFKVKQWTLGGHNHIKIIMTFKVLPHPTSGHRVLASVMRLHKVAKPTPGDPLNYKMVPKFLVENEEIAPATSNASFEITRADILPRDAVDDATMPANPVLIHLFEFDEHAQKAVAAANREAATSHSDHQGSATPPG